MSKKIEIIKKEPKMIECENVKNVKNEGLGKLEIKVIGLF